ncbi:Fur family transcriptional regulator [Amycolatopsis benzoatilytica]|uniref:Fur family transcriptional regulator n=1 Tax=Amycolatopsis benzoatilytica TaxID=346045 RepID=UPI000369333D|nr:transcriptional repressor [Amycolatopsis benzoatilytica]
MLTTPVPSDAPVDVRLRRAGLRVTTVRQVVLEVLADHPHVTVAELLPLVRTRLRMASTRAVHDVLATGVAAGLVHRFDHVGVAQRYEMSGFDHSHLLCRQCGRLEATAPTDSPGEAISGLCTSCR